MDLKEQFAQKMLDEELRFLPIEDAYELYKQGIIVPCNDYYVLPEKSDFDEWDGEGNETDHYIDQILSEYDGDWEMALEDTLDIGTAEELFDEESLELFPAPTYEELTK